MRCSKQRCAAARSFIHLAGSKVVVEAEFSPRQRYSTAAIVHRSRALINGRIPSDACAFAFSRALRRSSNESFRNVFCALSAIE